MNKSSALIPLILLYLAPFICSVATNGSPQERFLSQSREIFDALKRLPEISELSPNFVATHRALIDDALFLKSQMQKEQGRSMLQNWLDIVKDALTGALLRTPSLKPGIGNNLEQQHFNFDLRNVGLDWPQFGFTMVGRKRLDSLERIVFDVVANSKLGDFIECGVWRGGASIFAAILFDVLSQTDRRVFVADSFRGLPRASNAHDEDRWSKMPFLQVSQEEVEANFRNFRALRPNVRFVRGYFNESLPRIRSEIKALSILRLDGDMYESCADIIANLFDKLVVGGYMIVDDWFGFPCKDAVEDFFKYHNYDSYHVEAVDTLSVVIKKEQSFELRPEWYEDFVRTRQFV